jgi:protein tyrosine/serine phosphatase/uncharacterized protein YbaR (Trm112 family)
MPQVIIQPFDAATNKAISIINQKSPSLLKNVEKVIVHSSGGPELGHVAMGPGKNPREIHVFKNRIRDIVMRNANVTTKKTLTSQELEQAIVDGILETILHENVHIGPTKTLEQIAKGPFSSESEAEQTTKSLMSKIRPIASFKISKRATIEMACPHCKENVSHLKPEKNLVSLYKMLTCPNCKNVFYPQDVLLAVKQTKEKERPEKKVDEVISFNRVALKNALNKKLYAAISQFFINFNDYGLINNLAAWQHKNNLEITGKLDQSTIKKLSNTNSSPKSLPRNFAPVVPGVLYRGGLIMDESQLQSLKDLGVQRVVSLYANPDILRLCNKMNVEHVSAFIENGGPEDLGRKVFGSSVSQFLTEKPTYVHCFFGEDRTGGVIARFRTETGWPCKLAYAEAKHYGFKDIFVDLIDWFSEFCDEKPVDTDKIRKALGDLESYKNPEIMPIKEQDCSLPTPAPDDVPFQDMEPTSFPSYKNYITSPIPTSISTVPLSIRSSIIVKAQETKNEETADGIEEEEIDENDAEDIEPAVNIIGLQESEIEQNMNQSLTLEPFFSNIGNLG